MRLRSLAISGLVAACLLVGCGVYQVGVRTGPEFAVPIPPVDPAEVQLFGDENPALEGQEVGIVMGVSDVDEEALAIQRLRAAAAKIGADTIVDLRFQVIQSSQLVARGRALRRSPIPTMPPMPPMPPIPPPPVEEPQPLEPTTQQGAQP